MLLLAEGYATAASLHEATGYSVAYAFSANNLVKAGKQIRTECPALRLLICADDDYLTEGNPGCTAAAQATAEIELSAWIKPDFTGPDGIDLRGGQKLTDFNDLAVLHGGIGLPRQPTRCMVASTSWGGATGRKSARRSLGGGGGIRGMAMAPPGCRCCRPTRWWSSFARCGATRTCITSIAWSG